MSVVDHAKEDLAELFLHNIPHRWREWVLGVGMKRALLVVLAACAVLAKYVVLPWAVSHAVGVWADAHHLRLEVGDWSADLHDLTVEARDVSLRTAGPYAKNELFKAEAVAVDLSLWNRLDRGPWVREVVVKNPYLYVERQLSGYWNWQEVAGEGEPEPSSEVPGTAFPPPSGDVLTAGLGGAAAPSPQPGALTRALGWVVTVVLWALRLLVGLAFALSALFAIVGLVSLARPSGVLGLDSRPRAAGAALLGATAVATTGLLGLFLRPSPDALDLRALRIEGGRVEWVENLPGQSGGGLVHSSRATLFLDDLGVELGNLHGAGRPEAGATRFKVEGRMGGGRLSAHGDFVLATPTGPESGADSYRRVAVGVGAASPPTGAFAMRGEIYVENLQAGVLSQLAPDAALMPNTGALTGKLLLQRPLQPLELQCRTQSVFLSGFGWAPNPEAPSWHASAHAVRYLGEHRRSGPLPDGTDCGCKGSLASCRPLAAVLAAVTDAGIEGAPHEVQRAAATDQVRFTGVLEDGESPETQAKLAELVGAEMSAELLGGGAPGEPQSGALARLGGKVKHLFGH